MNKKMIGALLGTLAIGSMNLAHAADDAAKTEKPAKKGKKAAKADDKKGGEKACGGDKKGGEKACGGEKSCGGNKAK